MSEVSAQRAEPRHPLVLVAPRGFAPELRRELRRRFGLEASLRPEDPESWVETGVETLEEIVPLVYRIRTANRVLLELAGGPVRPEPAGLDDLEELTRSAVLAPWFDPATRFAVRCARRGGQDFSSREAAARVGAAVIEAVAEASGRSPGVDLDDPDLILRLEILDTRALLAVDLSGPRSLHRRGYLERPHRAALKATVAAALLDRAGWLPGESLLDPMCGGGTVLLEAGLAAAGLPAAYFRRDSLPFPRLPPFRELEAESLLASCEQEVDRERVRKILGADISLRTLETARINERRAGLEGRIEWLRSAIGALPREMGGRTFRRIVTNPPYGIRMGSRPEVEATHRRLIRAVALLLEPGGRCALVTTKVKLVHDLAAGHGLRAACRTVYLGEVKGGAFVLEAPP